MRTVFMGTPDFSARICEWLYDRVELVCVVSQPNKLAGRGRNELAVPPVAMVADRLGIPTLQPENVNDPEVIQELKKYDPDLIITAAYGQFLSQDLLDIPKLWAANVHLSLLPRHRGASPVNMAVINGDKSSGISIIEMIKKMDAGDILCSQWTDIEPDETAGKLFERLTLLSLETLAEFLDKVKNDDVTPIPQDPSLVTYAHKLNKEIGHIDWEKDAQQIYNLIRGCMPWPSTFTYFDAENKTRLKILKAKLLNNDPHENAPGEITGFTDEGNPIVAAKTGLIVIEKMHPESKKPLNGPDFVHGYRVKPGMKFVK